MKNKAMSQAGWALTGLALGAVGGFFAGRQWPAGDRGGASEQTSVMTGRAVIAGGKGVAGTTKDVAAGAGRWQIDFRCCRRADKYKVAV